VAEGLELANEISRAALLVQSSFIEVRAEVNEAGVLICEEVPDDDEDGSGDRDKGTLMTPSPDEAAITLAKERIGPRSRCAGLAKGRVAVDLSDEAEVFRSGNLWGQAKVLAESTRYATLGSSTLVAS